MSKFTRERAAYRQRKKLYHGTLMFDRCPCDECRQLLEDMAEGWVFDIHLNEETGLYEFTRKHLKEVRGDDTG